MENKYFTPEHEDFHVGYVCEVRQADNWIPYRVPANEYLSDLIGDGYRTKYLDKEDIESLGWYCIEKDNLLICNKSSNLDWFITINTDAPLWLDIECGQLKKGYKGEVKSINELKLIMKWLSIK